MKKKCKEMHNLVQCMDWDLLVQPFIYISRHRFLDGCARLFESHSLAGIFVYESFKHFGM